MLPAKCRHDHGTSRKKGVSRLDGYVHVRYSTAFVEVFSLFLTCTGLPISYSLVARDALADLGTRL